MTILNINILSKGLIHFSYSHIIQYYFDYYPTYVNDKGQTVGQGHRDLHNPDKAFFYDEISSPTDPGMARYCISVTYRHTAASTITKPTSKSNKFGNLITKLNNKEDITIVSIGDSITERWSASGPANVLPGCPSYSNLVTNYIREAYDVNVTNKNIAYSGKTSSWALNYCNDRQYIPMDKICTFDPDLVILAFGMNDGGGTNPTNFLTNINTILNKVKTNCPNACVVVVGTALPNPELLWNGGTSPFLNYHDDYSATLLGAENSWTNAAYADVTKAHMEMIYTVGSVPNLGNVKLNGRKSYQDTAGSNSNHPNDYFIRVYSQVIIQTIFGEYKLNPPKTA